MKPIALLLLSVILLNCAETYLPQKQTFSIEKADAGAIALVKSLSNTSVLGRIAPDDYDTDNLQLVSTPDRYYYSALSLSTPSSAITYVPDAYGGIKLTFTTTSAVQLNGDILSRVYSSDGSLRFTFTNHANGDRTWGTYYPPSNSSTEKSWWDNANACWNKFHTFSGYSIIDGMIITPIFNAATLGLYSPLSAVFCAGAAAAM